MIRIEVDTAYNCRPKKGERRAPDRSGRMMKCQIIIASALAEGLRDARATKKAGEKIAPGYSEVIAVRAYDNAAFNADPFGTAPIHTATAL